MYYNDPAQKLTGGTMVKRTFQPHNRKRNRTHGFLKRMRTPGGKRVVNSRRSKGRKCIIP